MSSQGCGLRADLVDLLGSLVLEPCLNQIVGQWGRGGPILLRIPSSPCPAASPRRQGGDSPWCREVGIRGASTANGIGVPLCDGGTSHASAVAIPLRRCCRSLRGP